MVNVCDEILELCNFNINENFSKDADEMFDFLASKSISDNEKDSVLKVMFRISESGDSTQKSFDRFAELALKIKDSKLKKVIVRLIKNIRSGAYKKEFKQRYNTRKGGSEVSVASELFSLFKQGYSYNKDD